MDKPFEFFDLYQGRLVAIFLYCLMTIIPSPEILKVLLEEQEYICKIKYINESDGFNHLDQKKDKSLYFVPKANSNFDKAI